MKHITLSVFLFSALSALGHCAAPDPYNPADPASDPYFAGIVLRCLLGDDRICPTGGGSAGSSGTTGSSDISQIQPSAAGSNLKLWLEADVLALADMTPVATWTDQSASGFNATQGVGTEQPLYRTGVLNGQPAVRFDGANLPGDHMILGSNYLFSANDGITILAVARSDRQDDVADFILDFGRANNAGYGMAYSANTDGVNSNLRIYVTPSSGGAAAVGADQTTTTDIVLIVARVKFSPATDKHISIYRNGELKFTDTTHTVTQLTAAEINESATRIADNGPVTIGGQSKSNVQNNKFFGGDIGLILWFDKALTEEERMGLECYAALKYNIILPQTCI